MPRKPKSINDLLIAGVIAAREKLYERAALTRTPLVFMENGKIVRRIPRMPRRTMTARRTK